MIDHQPFFYLARLPVSSEDLAEVLEPLQVFHEFVRRGTLRVEVVLRSIDEEILFG